MRPPLIQGGVKPDLAMTHAALEAEYDELQLELNDIEKTNSARK